MNVADVGRALLRHPVWVVLAVLVAVAAGGVTFSVVAPVQQSTASVVILPPATDDNGQNPLLNLDNTLAQLATVVGSALTSDDVRQQLAAQGATGSFTVANTTSDNPSFAQLSPELQFTVTAADPGVARRTAEALLQQAADQLTALQDRADVPDETRARAVVVAQPSAASVAGDGQVRAAGGVGLALLVLFAAVIVLLDAAVARRARRRQLAADTRKRIPRPSAAPAATGDRDRARAGS